MQKVNLVILKNKDESIKSYNLTDVQGKILARPKHDRQIQGYLAMYFGKDKDRVAKNINLVTIRDYA